MKKPRVVKLPKSANHSIANEEVPSSSLPPDQDNSSFDIYEEPLSREELAFNREQVDLRQRVS
jgi:hypothetical protein